MQALPRFTALTMLDLSKNKLGSVGAKAIAEAVQSGTAVLTECSLLKNELDVESATMLAKIGTEKRIMLSGMKQDQTTADFSYQRLMPEDAILIASDLPFMAVLTSIDVGGNSLNDQ